MISILSIDMSWNYLWVNSSWLAGSWYFGFRFHYFYSIFLYNENKDDEFSEYESSSETELESLLTSSDRSYGTA